MKPRVLHYIPNLLVGGAQRTVATLCRASKLDSRVEIMPGCLSSSMSWPDVVVLHAWRRSRESPKLNLPEWVRTIDKLPLIVFNHDFEGCYNGPANLVLVYSQFAAAHWQGPQQISIMPGGINVDRFSKAALSRQRIPSVVGRLSTLNPGKVSAEILARWPELKATAFLIGGGGEQLPILKACCRDQRFTFCGEISPRETHHFYAGIDIFLYDTDWHIESFCYVVLEALAAGCVVVASKRGAIGELVQNGVNGFLFQSPREAVRLCNLVLTDTSLFHALSRAAMTSARRFPADRMRATFSRHVIRILNER